MIQGADENAHLGNQWNSESLDISDSAQGTYVNKRRDQVSQSRMAQPSQYHDCNFCRKMIIDPNRKQPSPSETALSQMIFFEPKLAALLLAAPTCQFCQWLIDKWSANSSCHWSDLKKRAGEISLCLHYLSYSFDLLPIVEVTWIGLWDPRQELDEQDGRCRVQSRGYLDVVAPAGMTK